MTNYSITTPIYYVNDRPHIGHAYTTIVCDVMARFHAMKGDTVLFSTGTDEHGQKVEKSASLAGVPTRDFVDGNSQVFQDLCGKLNTRPTDFVRTTEARHERAVLALWKRLVDRNAIYLGNYGGWYAVKDEAFYGEGEIKDGRAISTGAEVEWVEEPSYFFRLGDWKDKLLAFYRDNPDFIQPESRRNEIISQVESGLSDLSISRTTFKWGIGVPGDDQHVIYVWIDALANYLTVAGFPDAGWEERWSATHVMGKDIIRFHAVYWPALLMAADISPPKKIVAHGWILAHDGAKMAKSSHNGIDPYAIIDQYGVDPLRYYLLREVSFGQDGKFSLEGFIRRNNTDLANDYGNLVNRTLSLVRKNLEGNIPQHEDRIGEAENLLYESIEGEVRIALISYEKFSFHVALSSIQAIISATNRYITEQEPWRKSTSEQEVILGTVLDVICQVSILLLPVIPGSANAVLDQIGARPDGRDFTHWGIIGDKIGETKIVFPKFIIDK